MRPSRKAGKQPAEILEKGAEAPTPSCPTGTGEDRPANCVGDDVLAKLDALEKRLDELQEALGRLWPDPESSTENYS